MLGLSESSWVKQGVTTPDGNYYERVVPSRQDIKSYLEVQKAYWNLMALDVSSMLGSNPHNHTTIREKRKFCGWVETKIETSEDRRQRKRLATGSRKTTYRSRNLVLDGNKN